MKTLNRYVLALGLASSTSAFAGNLDLLCSNSAHPNRIFSVFTQELKEPSLKTGELSETRIVMNWEGLNVDPGPKSHPIMFSEILASLSQELGRAFTVVATEFTNNDDSFVVLSLSGKKDIAGNYLGTFIDLNHQATSISCKPSSNEEIPGVESQSAGRR